MAELIQADTDGFDIEDIERPRTLAATCPACGRAAKLVECELVRNLTVLGVPIVATGRGGRVFQCPHCEAAFVPPEGMADVSADDELTDDTFETIAALQDRLDAAESELATWRTRVELAAKRGDEELARDARALVEKQERLVRALRDDLAKQRGGRHWSPADETAQEPVGASLRALLEKLRPQATGDKPAEAPASPPSPDDDDELASLRRKAVEKAAEKAAAEPSHEDAVAALRRKLGLDGAKPDAPKSPDAPKAPQAPAEPEDDEVAQLKRKLARPAPDAPPTPATPPAESSDDEAEALKRKLKKRD